MGEIQRSTQVTDQGKLTTQWVLMGEPILLMRRALSLCIQKVFSPCLWTPAILFACTRPSNFMQASEFHDTTRNHFLNIEMPSCKGRYGDKTEHTTCRTIFSCQCRRKTDCRGCGISASIEQAHDQLWQVHHGLPTKNITMACSFCFLCKMGQC